MTGKFVKMKLLNNFLAMGYAALYSEAGRKCNIACGQIDIGNARTSMAETMAVGALQADLSVRPEPTLDLAHVASAVLYMASLPLNANVQWLTVTPPSMPYIGRG
jgi:hypothetical protein